MQKRKPVTDCPMYDLIKAMADSSRRALDGDDALLYANFFTTAAEYLIYQRRQTGKPITAQEMLDWFFLNEHGEGMLKDEYL